MVVFGILMGGYVYSNLIPRKDLWISWGAQWLEDDSSVPRSVIGWEILISTSDLQQ